MRKVYVELKVRVILFQNDGIKTGKIVDELDYNFKDTTGHATVVDTEIMDYEVVDSK